ncbi:MBL fold metallo-hydrolase [Deinococcus cellulosilyticus]|uniref:Metallo-beta-lactamase domain-containing protein n=1 Tax=Deinococcus cellulosilyticus (strain DSM 18568 / NBRC 106333 / KACC 11606 / 5516J-15) TaxID=1223518 RepID=A0A511MY86_DEIC1|nr:MBL fold metallo-hydrolase [Deinococcus cellulosilyticus]GEM45554.1 hypothetical protein DC3_11890 [Deinococcus cellulosilyticus NBRC 106333 = KACC 11606]
MQLKLIRNATLRLSYAGHEILIDPMLGPKHSLPSFAGKEANPTTDLPVPLLDVLQGVDLVVVSHLHPDHFDETAQQVLSRDVPVLVQPGDERTFQTAGFKEMHVLEDRFIWQNLRFTRTPGQHGSGPILQRMGNVMGFILEAPGEPTLHWLGDTILTDDVLKVVQDQQPEVIVTHSAGAMIADTLLLMDAEQTLHLAQAAPQAVVVAVHMESLDHCTVSRMDLRQAARDAGLREGQLIVPEDGEDVQVEAKEAVRA